MEPCDISATGARAGIGARALSPVELLDSCVARIERLNPLLNALVVLCLDRARHEARAAEAAVMSGAPLGPLHGLPVAIKESEDVGGMPTTKGSRIYLDEVPPGDCGLVASLRAAGAIVVGKTNVPELTNGPTTDNPVYGRTLNPHALDRTCAGSSGGSAVALAAGMVPLATGSDTGGSIRGPASVCGITGLRPSPGLVPSEIRPLGWSLMTVLGPMARDALDTRLFLQGMLGEDPNDPFAAPIDPALRRPNRPIDLATLRVAASPDLGVVDLDPAVRECFAAKMARLAPAFGTVAWTDPDMTDVFDVYLKLRSSVHMTRYSRDIQENRFNDLTPQARADLARGYAMDARTLSEAMAENTRIYRRFQSFFRVHDLLITPGRALPFHTLTEIDAANARMRAADAPGADDATNGRGNINAPITMMGHPAITIPAGRDADGLPFGLQIIGRKGADDFLLRAAIALEAHCAGDVELARPVLDFEAIANVEAAAD